jgi:hypothetical protein
LPGIVCSNGTKEKTSKLVPGSAFGRRWRQICGDFLFFLKHFSGQSNIGVFRGNIPLGADEQRKLFFKAEQGAVLSIFWHERCCFT